ncbi:MAG TPA: 3-oxoacyl-ACP reductase [Gammaproteobacteria bacterium]|nr:3-oxoacyl-ACP reductase [Gammaproteobacteria bacterium]
MEYKHAKVGKFLELDGGLKMHYHERGEGGIPLIFLHGGGQGSGGWTNWKTNLDFFADAGYHAIAPDAIGYGLSDKPEDGNFDFDSLMAALTNFIDKKGFDNVNLVGNSMGGAMSIRFTQDHPDRVDKLTVMAPGGIGPMERYLAMPAIAMLKELGQQEGGFTKDKLRTFLEYLTFAPAVVDEELLNERYEVALSQPPKVFQTLNIVDLRDRLHVLKNKPLLVLWGRDDRACPVESAMEIMAECDNAKLVVYSETGHWVQAEQNEDFNRTCLEFLRK